MGANDQPSILTVCIPSGSRSRDQQDFIDIFAAREEAVARAVSQRGVSYGSSIEGAPADSACDSCDDSACGLDAVSDSSAGCDRSNSDAGASQAVKPNACQPSFFHADSGKKALELLRLLRFDLLVTGDRLPDMPVTQLIRRVRVAWPWQKWAMVGSMISTQDEIDARTLGAIAVFDAPPDWEALGSLASAVAGSVEAAKSNRSEAAPQAMPMSKQNETVATNRGDSRIRALQNLLES